MQLSLIMNGFLKYLASQAPPYEKQDAQKVDTGNSVEKQRPL